MIIRYISCKNSRTFDDRFMEKHMTKVARLTKKLSREELEQECQRLQKNQWDTKVFGLFRGAKFARLLQTCVELLLMGLIEHVNLFEENGRGS